MNETAQLVDASAQDNAQDRAKEEHAPQSVSNAMAIAIDSAVIVALVGPVRVLLDTIALRTVGAWAKLVFVFIGLGFLLAIPGSMVGLLRVAPSRFARLAMGINGAFALGVILAKPVGYYSFWTVLGVMIVGPVLVRLALLGTKHHASYARYGLLAFSLAVALATLGGQHTVRTAIFASDRLLWALRERRTVAPVEIRSIAPTPVQVAAPTPGTELPFALIIRVQPLRTETVFDQRFTGLVTIARNSARFVDARANAVLVGSPSQVVLPTDGRLPATVECVSGEPRRVADCAREQINAHPAPAPLRLALTFAGPTGNISVRQYDAYIMQVDRAIAAVLPLANARTPLRQALVALMGTRGFSQALSYSSSAFAADDAQRVPVLISAPRVRPAFVRSVVTLNEAEAAIAQWNTTTPPEHSVLAQASIGAPLAARLVALLDRAHPSPKLVVTDGRYVMEVDRRVPTYTLIDLTLDPHGVVNRADILPGIRSALTETLALWSSSAR